MTFYKFLFLGKQLSVTIFNLEFMEILRFLTLKFWIFYKFLNQERTLTSLFLILIVQGLLRLCVKTE